MEGSVRALKDNYTERPQIEGRLMYR
jgi:hypothetical protein